MKKFIVLSLFVALFLNAKAQTSFGLKGGFNLASVKIAVAEAGISVSTKSKTSFVIGGYLNHPLTESLSNGGGKTGPFAPMEPRPAPPGNVCNT